MKTKIIIIGGRGTAIVIAEQIYDAQMKYGLDVEVIGLALDDLSGGDNVSGYPILCPIKDVYSKYADQEDVKFIYSLYRPDVIKERTEILNNLNIPLEKFYNFIHPSATVAKSVTMGYGNVILANCVLNSNSKLGNFNTFNSGGLIGHDTTIGNNNFCAAHMCISSSLIVGDMNFVGLNSVVNKNMGSNNFVGACSNITKDVQSNSKLHGNPAKVK